MKKVYISGPMSGYENMNHGAFIAAEVNVRDLFGVVEIYNPARRSEMNADVRPPLTREWYMMRNIEDILQCTHIYMLRGWSASPGAMLELNIARQIGLTVTFSQYMGANEADR